MKTVLLAIAVVIVTGLAACGGDEGGTAEPLTLEQRVLSESDVPGSKSDPVETRLSAGTLDEFTAWRDSHVRAAEVDPGKLEKAGFVAAIHDTRFLPETPDGAHTPDAPHLRILVLQFESEDGALTGADLLHENGLQPCPGTCVVQMEEFEVSGVPDARGVRSFATAERLQQTGEERQPFDSYSIWFADGPFAYELEGGAPPGGISEEQVEDIAEKVHERIEGAPAAGT